MGINKRNNKKMSGDLDQASQAAPRPTAEDMN